jgi:hypothetical protein
MAKFSTSSHLPKIINEVESLLSGTSYNVRDFVENRVYEKFPEQGMYAFTDPDDEEVVYIGKSMKHRRGVGGRARHHARPGGSLQRKLGVNQDRFYEYNVRVRPISDSLICGAAEVYGIAVYMPKANKLCLETEGKHDLESAASANLGLEHPELGLPHFRLLCGISAIHNDVLARGERRTG